MSDDGKVVFLKLRTTNQSEDMLALMACKHCRNKTFTHTEDIPGDFLLVRCAACGQHIGRVGWTEE